MATHEQLRAVFAAEDRASGPIEDIADEAEHAAASLDFMEMMGDGAERTLSSLARTATQAVGPLDSAAASEAAVGSNAALAAQQVDELDDALADVDANAIGRVPTTHDVEVRAEVNDASFMAARAAIEGLPDSRSVDVTADVDRDSFATPQPGFSTALADGGLSGVLPPLSDQDVGVDVEGTDELAAGAAAAHLYSEGLDSISPNAAQASAMSAVVAEEADEAGDSMLSAVPGGEAMASTLGNVRSAALGAVPGLYAAGSAADEYGDEASEAAAESAALSAAMGGVGGSGLTSELLGVRGGLSSILAIGATLLPMIVALGGAFGGLAVGAASVAGILGAGIFGGLLAQGEELVGTTQRVGGELQNVTSAAEGVEAIMSDLKRQAMEAIAPLQQPMFQELAMNTLEGGVQLLGRFAESAATVYRKIEPLVDVVSGAFWDQTPAFFTAMEEAAVALAPVLADLLVYLANNIPQAISFMTSAATDLAPTLAEIAGALIQILPPLAQVGGLMLTTLAPALSLVSDLFVGALKGLQPLLAPLAALGAIASDVVSLFEPLIQVLGAVVGPILAIGGTSIVLETLAGVITGVAVPALRLLATAAWSSLGPWGVVAAAIGGVISMMGGFDGVIGTVIGMWNELLDVAEGVIGWIANNVGKMVDALLLPLQGPIMLFNALNPGKKNDLPTVGSMIQGKIGTNNSADLSSLKVDQASTDSEEEGPGGSAGTGVSTAGGATTTPTGGAGAAGGDTYDQSKQEINIYASSEDIKNPSKFKRMAREAIREFQADQRTGAGA